MTEMSAEYKALAEYRPTQKVRFVTAASLFDGHDAAINIMRRILQSMGAEVIHLGHNRSVDEVVTAALQEDAQGIAVSYASPGEIRISGTPVPEPASVGLIIGLLGGLACRRRRGLRR